MGGKIISDAKKDVIKELYCDDGLKQVEIADRLGISASSVSRVLYEEGILNKPIKEEPTDNYGQIWDVLKDITEMKKNICDTKELIEIMADSSDNKRDILADFSSQGYEENHGWFRKTEQGYRVEIGFANSGAITYKRTKNGEAQPENYLVIPARIIECMYSEVRRRGWNLFK